MSLDYKNLVVKLFAMLIAAGLLSSWPGKEINDFFVDQYNMINLWYISLIVIGFYGLLISKIVSRQETKLAVLWFTVISILLVVLNKHVSVGLTSGYVFTLVGMFLVKLYAKCKVSESI